MTRAQWKALTDYCTEFGYTRVEVLRELKANGTVDKDTKLDDLGDCVTNKDYDSMLKFLEDNV